MTRCGSVAAALRARRGTSNGIRDAASPRTIPYEPVIIDARAARTSDAAAIQTFTDAVNVKYETDYGVDFFGDNALWVARPTSVFALDEADFPGSPTRWTLS